MMRKEGGENEPLNEICMFYVCNIFSSARNEIRVDSPRGFTSELMPYFFTR